jgi:hypothetical protein
MRAEGLHPGVILRPGAWLGGQQVVRKASLYRLSFPDLSRIAPERSSA